MGDREKDGIEMRAFWPRDWSLVIDLWQSDENIGLSDADSEEHIVKYLARNPGGSFLAVKGNQVVGSILCGHDGRRGYIHHLYVAVPFRGMGIGRRLVEAGLDYFKFEEIDKCHLFIFETNGAGKKFWRSVGFSERRDLGGFSKTLVK